VDLVREMVAVEEILFGLEQELKGTVDRDSHVYLVGQVELVLGHSELLDELVGVGADPYTVFSHLQVAQFFQKFALDLFFVLADPVLLVETEDEEVSVAVVEMGRPDDQA
jgi:hypothetical protein